jgi:hypothetical protein
LLSLILGAHSQIASLGEIVHLPRFLRTDLRCTCGAPASQCEFWQGVLAELEKRGTLSLEGEPGLDVLPQGPRSVLAKRWVQFLAALGGLALVRASDLVLRMWNQPIDRLLETDFAVYDAARGVSGCQAVVDSSKFYLRMKLLYMHRPEGFKTIYLVRDGRAVMASNIKRGIAAEVGARHWVKANRAAAWMLKTMSPHRRLRLNYEEFCADPAAQLQRICRFVGLPDEPQALEYRRAVHHDLGGNRMRFGEESAIRNQETWRRSLSQRDLDTFERIGGRLNRRLGYG